MDWSQVAWYAARASGLVAFALLTTSVCLGIVLSLKWRTLALPRFVTNEVHRFATILALVFTLFHGVALYIDPFMKFTPAEIAVPLAAHYRPLWVGLGVTAAYLMAALYASSWIQRWIGFAWWRRFHYLAFAAYLAVVVHGLGSGSDSQATWAFYIYAGSVFLVAALLAARLLSPDREGRRAFAPATVAGVGLLLLGGWAFSGPLQPGWNQTANYGHGTGSRLPAPVVASSLPLPFQSTLQGRYQRQGSAAQTALQYDTTLSGAPGGSMQVRLIGQTQTGNRLVVNDSTVVLRPSGSGPVCTGSVTQIQRSTMVAQCATQSGDQVQLQIVVQVDADGNVTGTVDGSRL
jgi:DMSO/TMAO reductase YedYZ heme-binding membrane subunit